jgi:hypothetical protein
VTRYLPGVDHYHLGSEAGGPSIHLKLSRFMRIVSGVSAATEATRQ